MAEMDELGILQAARALRPYLPQLVGPDSEALDARLAERLAATSRGENVTDALWPLLSEREETLTFAAWVILDAPHYRPPDLQPDHPGERSGLQPLPGDIGPVHADRYVCPNGDYVWYRRVIGTPIPACPTHGPVLVRG